MPEKFSIQKKEKYHARKTKQARRKTKQSNQSKVDLRVESSGVTVSKGITDLSTLIVDY